MILADSGGVRPVRPTSTFSCDIARPVSPTSGPWRSAPDRIRTCDLRFRRPTLYPAELRAREAPSLAMGSDLFGVGGVRRLDPVFRRAELGEERRVVRGLLALAVVARDPASLDLVRQFGRRQHVVDPQPEPLVEVAGAVVPPRVGGRVGMQAAEASRRGPASRIASKRERSSSVTCVSPTNAAGSYTSRSVRQTLKSPAISTGRSSATSSGTRSAIASRNRSLSGNAGASIAWPFGT